MKLKPGDLVKTENDVIYLADIKERHPSDSRLPDNTIGMVVATTILTVNRSDYPYVLFLCANGLYWSSDSYLWVLP